MNEENNDFESVVADIKKIHEIPFTILNSMGDAVIVKDDQSRILFANHAFCKLFHRSESDIIGNTLIDAVDYKEANDFLEIDRKVLSEGIEIIKVETLTLKNGISSVISTRKSCLLAPSGSKYLICVIRDVTDNQKAEKALQQSEEKYRKLSATKDKLISIFAHDLRSPFINNISLVKLISNAVENDNIEEIKEYISLISETSQNALTLLDNLLNWAMSQTGSIKFTSEKENLNTIFEQIINFSGPSAKAKNIELSIGHNDVKELYTDKRILNIFLGNLLSNAIKFTKPGGVVTLSAKTWPSEYIISVTDNGVGIEENVLTKLFDTKVNITTMGTANEYGYGFGLILCKELVEKLDGKIWVESEFGKGSTFKISLPRSGL